MKTVVDVSDEELEMYEWLSKEGISSIAIRKILNGTLLPEGAEILTKEAYSDLCLRASHERRTGKWVHGREIWREHIGDAIIAICYENWRCGECGALVKDEASKVLWKYCPWCGAEMKGAE